MSLSVEGEAKMEIDTSTNEAIGCGGAACAITENNRMSRVRPAKLSECANISYLKCLIITFISVFCYFLFLITSLYYHVCMCYFETKYILYFDHRTVGSTVDLRSDT